MQNSRGVCGEIVEVCVFLLVAKRENYVCGNARAVLRTVQPHRRSYPSHFCGEGGAKRRVGLTRA